MVPSRAEDVDREEQVTLAEPIPLPVHDGVGRFFDLADLRKGESVLDLGSGSGMDAFLAAHYVGPAGRVLGIDMTGDQLAKASRLAERLGYTNVEFRKGFLEELPVEQGVFREIHRVLRPGGRLALVDIVTEKQLAEAVTCNSNRWAACIGGAERQDRPRDDRFGGSRRAACGGESSVPVSSPAPRVEPAVSTVSAASPCWLAQRRDVSPDAGEFGNRRPGISDRPPEANTRPDGESSPGG
jgi:SAM-dependent methyltransferase